MSYQQKKSRYFEIYVHIYEYEYMSVIFLHHLWYVFVSPTLPIASSNVTGSLRRNKNLKVKWELRNLHLTH